MVKSYKQRAEIRHFTPFFHVILQWISKQIPQLSDHQRFTNYPKTALILSRARRYFKYASFEKAIVMYFLKSEIIV